MTYAIAKAKLVTEAEATTPTTHVAGLGATKFAHAAEMASDNERTFRSRSFCIEAAVDGDGAVDTPYTPDIAAQPRVTTRATMTVHYSERQGKRADLDLQVEADALALAKRFMTPSNLGPRTTTNIDYVDRVTWRRRLLQGGDVRLTLSFDLHYF